MERINKRPIFNELNNTYTGGIKHKDYYLFLNPSESEVVVYNSCLKKIGNIKTNKYQSITENKEECYFILTKINDKDFLYKATYDLLEFDCIKLNVPNKYKETINDIYSDEVNSRIYMVTDHYVYTITPDGFFIKEESHCDIISTSNKTVKNLNGCCIQSKPIVKNDFMYTAVGKCTQHYVSYIKNEKAYLYQLNDSKCNNDTYLGDDIKVISMFVSKNKLTLLIVRCNKYNYLYELDIKCNECNFEGLDCCEKLGHIPKCHKSCNESCFDKLNCCENFSCCENFDCCDKLDCKPKCYRPCNDPVACVLESIALEQTALSHILNAEGEKIQKAIAANASVCELLKINESVTETIFNTTMLEHVLQEKISKVLKYDCKKKC